MKRIAISMGEPAGIGPDLIIRAAQLAAFNNGYDYQRLVIGCKKTLLERAALLGLPLDIKTFEPNDTRPSLEHEISLIDIACKNKVAPGKLDKGNSLSVLQTLNRAAKLCLNGEADALVTPPVHKGVINDAGRRFSGHTEFFADIARCEKVVMMLANQHMRVALVTTHIPLAQVASSINASELKQTLAILQQDLKTKFAIEKPHIVVLGLNPHAGEDGHMGREEIDIITPVLDEMRARHMLITGPLPADTAFTQKYLNSADAFVAMYHDQGLPVLKYAGFGQSVNITLGLPFIRTSVDHGTAIELAASDKIDTGSFDAAITQALRMANAH